MRHHNITAIICHCHCYTSQLYIVQVSANHSTWQKTMRLKEATYNSRTSITINAEIVHITMFEIRLQDTNTLSNQFDAKFNQLIYIQRR